MVGDVIETLNEWNDYENGNGGSIMALVSTCVEHFLVVMIQPPGWNVCILSCIYFPSFSHAFREGT